ncbi:MAG: phosphate ABC transporter permease subunit PstC, partial [Coriobacteriia bacterium]|nr:phosphate ABC transporter permease subunit PstC [Coriobacteriia bacterium]
MSEDLESHPAPGQRNSPAEEPKGTLRLVSRGTYVKELALKNIFLLCAFVAVAGVVLIFAFVGVRGWPVFAEVGVWNFLTGSEWSATQGKFGILAPIYGSVLVMFGALALGTPLAVGTAIFLSE